MSVVQVELVVIVIVLLLVNAAFAGSELALISLRPSQVERLREKGRAGEALARLMEDPNEFLATIQVGITLAGFLASATAATSFADDIAPYLGFLGRGARPAAVVGVTIVLTYLTLVIGELAPKRIAIARAEGWALIAALPLRWLGAVSRPAVWILSRSTNVVVRAAGVDPRQDAPDISDEELRDTVLRRAPARTQREIFEGAFEVGERVLRQIVTPRDDVTTVPLDASTDEAVKLLVQTGHTRAPLADDLDHVLGIVHINDLIARPGHARDCVRPALFLPETVGVLDALARMQRDRQQVAVVVDEYSGGAGIVTVEDVLEEIVGEIYDEFDPDHSAVEPQQDGTIVLDGRFPLHDLRDFGVDIPESPAATVAGFVVERLGHLPEPGARLAVGEWILIVEEADARAVRSVRVVHAGEPQQ